LKTAKIIQAFSSFSKADWTSFRKFILSKTGKDSEIFTLFLELQKRKNALADQQILDTIYKKSFHKKTAKVFSNMQSQLFQWCEEWLIIDQLNKDKYLPELLLLKSLNRRGNFKLADQTAKKPIRLVSSAVLQRQSYQIQIWHTTITEYCFQLLKKHKRTTHIVYM